MNLYNKISILGPNAQYDTCGPKDFGSTSNIPGVYHAKVAGNRICRLFKVLQTNKCVNDCYYCALRGARACPRTTASSDEMAEAFYSAFSRRLVDVLFLSSGIDVNSDSTMTRMLDTAHILRDKYNYNGYMHLKIMPGSSNSCITEAIKLSSRISLNVESPTKQDLFKLSPSKYMKGGFFSTLSIIKKELDKFRLEKRRAPSLTTQFVVGAGDENDKRIIQVADLLYQSYGLYRVFFSAFRPVPNTPLEDKPPASCTREHRLYQADFLMRFYRFSAKDIPFGEKGFLSEGADPKMIWAKQHPEYYPININSANYWKLLKIPGIGPTSAKKILKMREITKIRSLNIFKGMRMQLNKASEFITL